ncbi:unnamed protein product [Adineta ricciae]|uniref:Uncharacterized protein n=1 Tax=Adineta ricciae TaxID=249248 RepID=A0A815V8B1_ADIRI|nr:unnamed protein product [Adineta ricciae]CAF1532541.1 unnamed protein product [Adineta ricciae]
MAAKTGRLASKPGLWKIFLLAAIFLALVAFILGWIGFGVPQWQWLQRSNTSSVTEYYGLWAYCQDQTTGTVCRHWSDAADQLFNGSRPSFISTSEGLITTGMIMLSLGLVAGLFSLILPLLCYLAGILMFLAFLFIVIGVPIFGTKSNDLSSSRGDVSYGKRYGFGLMIATIVLSFISMLLFLIAGFLYQRFGFGNIASRSKIRVGQQQLGGYNVINRPPYGYPQQPYGYPQPPYGNARPPYGMYPMPTAPYPYSVVGAPQPSLLSQYIAQRLPRSYSGPVIRRTAVAALPQPSVIGVVGAPSYVTPAYYKVAPAVQSAGAPIVNLTGRTIVGPVVRSA